jgi:hypothetical protein
LLEEELDEESPDLGDDEDDEVDESGCLVPELAPSDVDFESVDFESDLAASDDLLSGGVREDAPP